MKRELRLFAAGLALLTMAAGCGTGSSSDPNHMPTISGTPAVNAPQGAAYSFTPTSADEDAGDTLTFSAQNLPAWLTLNPATGNISGTPGPADVGTASNITVKVTDKGGKSATLAAFSITVPYKDPSVIASIPKYVTPLVIPPAMPTAGTSGGETYYEIAAAQISQQILPAGYPKTTVYAYGKKGDPATFHYPAFTVEVEKDQPVRVKWINDLVDSSGKYLKHILPVDQTIEWANPAGAAPTGSSVYTGPVPISTHVHGAHVTPESDGHPLAWHLPAASDLPAGIAKQGSMYGESPVIGAAHEDGAAYFRYTNDQPATALWYHDHTMGMTRLNVYAGLAGFWFVRDAAGEPANLPGPSPKLGEPAGTKYYEIPLAIQDKSFKADGSLFYPDSREFFDGFTGPYEPEVESTPPVWNPEFFGEVMMVNGRTWPYLDVEPRKYRLRMLNGCNARFLILAFDQAAKDAGVKFTVIGNEAGLLPDAPLVRDELILSPAERFDVIVDFSGLAAGAKVVLKNLGPDEPFKGLGNPENGPAANPETTGQVMQFNVVASTGADTSATPATLPAIAALDPNAAAATRDLTLHEIVYMQGDDEYPTEAKMGTLLTGAHEFMDPVTETPKLNTTEIWRIINFTADAHPIHLHLTQFQVLDRTPIDAEGLLNAQQAYLANNSNPTPVLANFVTGAPEPAFPWEGGYKETVTAPPGMVTRVIAKFDILGNYVWHCHIVEHEDNEMMRPFTVIP